MSVSEFLADLRRRHVSIAADAHGTELRCKAPQGVLTAELVAEIRARKADILAFLARGDQDGSAPMPAIEPIARGGALPMSFAQQRAWFLEQILPGCPMHNIPGAWRLIGELNLAAFRRSIEEIVRRHEVLRCTFGDINGLPNVNVRDSAYIDVPLIDLRQIPDEARHCELLQRIAVEVQTPFDLVSGPLLRTSLYRIGDSSHVFFLMPHHIVWDAWSFDLFWGELAAIYPAFVDARPSPLAELPIQYVDYAAWEQNLLSGSALENDLAYWRRQLGGERPILQLPTDRPRPAQISYRGTTEFLPLSPRWVADLNRFCLNEQVTPYMAVLAAINVVLAQYSGQDEFLIGCPIENTMQPEIEPLIGYFVNMLVLRNRVDRDQSFRDLLRSVRGTCLDAFSHQRVPFEHLVNELAVPRDTSRTPLFQSIFLFQDASRRPLNIGDLQLVQFNIPMGSSQTDLHFWLKKGREGWLLGIDYSTDLFHAETVERILKNLIHVIETATRSPEISIGQLATVPEDERRRLLIEWNDTATSHEDESNVCQRFAAQALANPDAIAVETAKTALSYGELDRRSNQLAAHLQKLGVGKGQLVGICLDRTTDLLVGLLGILKAGGAFLPIDPFYPQARIDYMLENSGATVLVVDQLGAVAVPETQVQVVNLDLDATAIFEVEFEGLRAVATEPEDLAYVIYTSGSTGNPKGVQIPQRALSNFLASMAREPGLKPNDCLAAVTTLSFDIAGLELFLPLTVGARIRLIDRETSADGASLAKEIAAAGVTVMQATPTTWRLLINAGWQGNDLRKVLCGGESLPADLAGELQRRCGEVWNMYGPTETTIWSTCQRLADDDDVISIGRPIANTQLYVLDDRMRLVPIGAVGELYIGGDGLAHGYLNRPELTAERFVANPFGDEGHSRLYRTGDYVRYLADGRLQYLQRIDHQVKVRGFRIELAEVESALKQHPAIEETVVQARDFGGGDRRLVAYYVLDPTEDEPTATELRAHLKAQLPDYMVPGILVELDELPRTPNGKVDRAALPEPGFQPIAAAESYLAPTTATEKLVAEIWQAALRMPRVGTNDNFFDLGGHSLLSIQVISKIERQTGVRLSPRDFVLQTLRQISQTCDEQLSLCNGSSH